MVIDSRRWVGDNSKGFVVYTFDEFAAFRSQRGHPKINCGMDLKIKILKSIDKELLLLINGQSILRVLRPFNAAVLRCGPQVNCLSRRKPRYLIIGFQWWKVDPILIVEPMYFLFLVNKIASVLLSFGKSFQYWRKFLISE